MRRFGLLIAVALSLSASRATADTINIEFTDVIAGGNFFAIGDTSLDVTSTTLSDQFGFAGATNDPNNFFDPALIVYTGVPSQLEFDVAFTLGAGSTDSLRIAIFTDVDAFGQPIPARSVEFSATIPSGHITMLFSGLAPATYGIDISLASTDIFDPVGSMGTVSNMQFITDDTGGPGPAPIPEPGTLMLVAAGLGTALLWRRRRT